MGFFSCCGSWGLRTVYLSSPPRPFGSPKPCWVLTSSLPSLLNSINFNFHFWEPLTTGGAAVSQQRLVRRPFHVLISVFVSTSDVVAQCLLISISSPPRFPQLKLSPHSCLLFPSLIIASSSVAPSCDQISCHVTGAMLSHLQRDRPLHPTPHFPTFPPFNKCYTKMAIYKNTKRNGICPLVAVDTIPSSITSSRDTKGQRKWRTRKP